MIIDSHASIYIIRLLHQVLIIIFFPQEIYIYLYIYIYMYIHSFIYIWIYIYGYCTGDFDDIEEKKGLMVTFQPPPVPIYQYASYHENYVRRNICSLILALTKETT